MSRFRQLRRRFLRQSFVWKLLLVIVAAATLAIGVLLLTIDYNYIGHGCYDLSADAAAASRLNANVRFFEDISESARQPTPGRSIFFHETSCARDGLMHLDAK